MRRIVPLKKAGIITAVTATVLALGGGVALADTPGPTPAPPPPTAQPGSNAAICTVRIPKLLARIDRLTTRIDADATTKGSTAWLQAKEDKARSSGRTALADLIAARISDRPQRLSALAQAKMQVLGVQSKDCGS